MAKKVDSGIIAIAEKYADEVKRHYHVDEVILFGSFAKGGQHKDSDIDIAVVSDDIVNASSERLNLMRYRRNIDLRIEPHLVSTVDYRRVENPFIAEIVKTGIRIGGAV